MHTDWLQLALQLRRQYEAGIAIRDKAWEFRYWCKYLLDVPYVWGAENLMGTDCSGTVCWALMRMGYDIRTTADALMRKVFTDIPTDELDYHAILAVFYVNEEGVAKHVTPVVGRYVVLNAGDSGIQLHTAAYVRELFEATGHKVIWRKLNFDNAIRLSEIAAESWEVDPMVRILEG